MDGWNTSFLLGWPIFRGYVTVVSGGVSVVSWSFVPFIDNEKNKWFLVHTKDMIRATRVLKKTGPFVSTSSFLEVWFFRFFRILILIYLNLDHKLLYVTLSFSFLLFSYPYTPSMVLLYSQKKMWIRHFPIQTVGYSPSTAWLEPKLPLFLKVNPPKQGHQNKGHLGSRENHPSPCNASSMFPSYFIILFQAKRLPLWRWSHFRRCHLQCRRCGGWHLRLWLWLQLSLWLRLHLHLRLRLQLSLWLRLHLHLRLRLWLWIGLLRNQIQRMNSAIARTSCRKKGTNMNKMMGDNLFSKRGKTP